MVRTAEAGHIVMTNGPYLEVQARSQVHGEFRTATAGDNLVADSGHVDLEIRVQCANWLDVNRVFLLFNGQPQSQYDFRRATHADLFQQQTVKFHHTLSLDLATDTHVVVVAAGEGLKLGPVVGPDHQDEPPIAVANPIYVDMDGNGFQPNGDLLGVPLPIAAGP
jgi:hypothetical protein